MKGEVRSGMTTWILAIATCGLYGFYWWYTALTELKTYLGKDELNPVVDVLLFFCPIINMIWPFYMPLKMGKLVQEAQARAGLPASEDQGVKFLLFQCLCGYGYCVMQEELNKVWTAGGMAAAPTAA